MAIVGQIVVESRRYSGWIDPRYPIGYWQAALALTADGSGGSLGIDLLFQPADPSFLNSQMYSVERIGIRTNNGTTRTVRVAAINMGGPSNEGFNHEYTVSLDAVTGVSSSAIGGNQLTMLPWFLGSQRIAGTSASLSLLAQNTGTITYKIEAEGYRWSARSVLIDGGPQRPPTGPYGR